MRRGFDPESELTAHKLEEDTVTHVRRYIKAATQTYLLLPCGVVG